MYLYLSIQDSLVCFLFSKGSIVTERRPSGYAETTLRSLTLNGHGLYTCPFADKPKQSSSVKFQNHSCITDVDHKGDRKLAVFYSQPMLPNKRVPRSWSKSELPGTLRVCKSENLLKPTAITSTLFLFHCFPQPFLPSKTQYDIHFLTSGNLTSIPHFYLTNRPFSTYPNNILYRICFLVQQRPRISYRIQQIHLFSLF